MKKLIFLTTLFVTLAATAQELSEYDQNAPFGFCTVSSIYYLNTIKTQKSEKILDTLLSKCCHRSSDAASCIYIEFDTIPNIPII